MNLPDERSIPIVERLEGIETIFMQPEEAFVFSRVDGKSSLKEIALILSYDVPQVWKLLSRFIDEGFLRLAEPKETPRERKKDSTDPSVLARLKEDENDVCLRKIPEEFRKEILLRFQALAKHTHYEVLEVNPKAKAETIKKSYFRLVKKYHPDRLFDQQTTFYCDRLEQIFGRITEAFEVLTDALQA